MTVASPRPNQSADLDLSSCQRTTWLGLELDADLADIVVQLGIVSYISLQRGVKGVCSTSNISNTTCKLFVSNFLSSLLLCYVPLKGVSNQSNDHNLPFLVSPCLSSKYYFSKISSRFEIFRADLSRPGPLGCTCQIAGHLGTRIRAPHKGTWGQKRAPRSLALSRAPIRAEVEH